MAELISLNTTIAINQDSVLGTMYKCLINLVINDGRANIFWSPLPFQLRNSYQEYESKIIWVRLFYDDASKRGIDYVTSSNLWHRSNVRGCSFTHSPVSRTGGSPCQGKKEQAFSRMGLSLVGCEGHSTAAPA
jgi:hypothetical protein